MGFFSGLVGSVVPSLVGGLFDGGGGSTGDKSNTGGFLGKIFGFLKKAGSSIFQSVLGASGPVLGSIIGDKLASERQVENSYEVFKQQWEHKLNAGLTPWEINSSGGGASNAPTPPNTLGNSFGSAVQQQKQLQFMALQNALERQNRLEIAQVAAEAPSRQASVAERRVALDEELNPQKIAQMKAQTALLVKQHVEYWPSIYAKMGPENVMAALATANAGVSLEKILTGFDDLTEEERQAIEALYGRLLAAKTALGSNFLTVPELLSYVLDFTRKGLSKVGGTLGEDGVVKKVSQHGFISGIEDSLEGREAPSSGKASTKEDNTLGHGVHKWFGNLMKRIGQ